jgi:hypothetical protein
MSRREEVSELLPELLDCKALRAELGVSRAAAEAIMRAVPTVTIPGLPKTPPVRRRPPARGADVREEAGAGLVSGGLTFGSGTR